MEIQGKYTSAKIFAETIEDEALAQCYDLINHPAFENARVRWMSDIHRGKSVNIGTTAELTDYVNPSHVGCDIGCSVTSIFYDKVLDPKDYALAEHRVKEAIPMGFNINESRQFECKEFYKFLNSRMSNARSCWSDMVYKVKVDEKYITNMLRRIGMDEGVFYKSISTLGSGNHFCEYGESWEGNGVWTIHTGSRNFGQKVFKYWDTVSKRPSPKKNLDKEIAQIRKKYANNREMIGEAIKQLKNQSTEERKFIGYLSGEDMKGYLTDVFFCQAYAAWNHEIIKRKISEIMLKFGLKETNVIQSVHNYINPYDHIIRKGAIAAHEGDFMIIPFNMRDGLAICVGKGNPDWNYSAPHGAGRIMSRGKAKSQISLEDFQKSMEGIYTTSVNEGTIDESPMVYKNMDEIVRLIEPTCKILGFVRPKINIKAGGE